MNLQLFLDIKLDEMQLLSNFIVNEKNNNLIAMINNIIREPRFKFIFIFSPYEAGKTHLLHAICNQCFKLKIQSSYIPLRQIGIEQIEILDNPFLSKIICIDDIQQIIGQKQWELALFKLYHECQDNNIPIIITSNQSIVSLPWLLADLRSRFAGNFIYKLVNLNDVEILLALTTKAQQQGWYLSDDVANFLLRRCGRNLKNLFKKLQIIGDATLIHQRKTTIPFVKQVLNI